MVLIVTKPFGKFNYQHDSSLDAFDGQPQNRFTHPRVQHWSQRSGSRWADDLKGRVGLPCLLWHSQIPGRTGDLGRRTAVGEESSGHVSVKKGLIKALYHS